MSALLSLLPNTGHPYRHISIFMGIIVLCFLLQLSTMLLKQVLESTHTGKEGILLFLA